MGKYNGRFADARARWVGAETKDGRNVWVANAKERKAIEVDKADVDECGHIIRKKK